MNEPRLPIDGEFVRHVGRLVKIQEIPPKPQPPPVKDYIFEDIEAKCEIRLNGETIKGIQTLNDSYGLKTGINTAIKEMKEYAKERNIGPKSDIEVVVVKVTKQFRARPINKENFYDKIFFDFKQLEYGSQHDLPDPVEIIVWSSKNG